MRAATLLLALAALTPANARAQRVEITPFAGFKAAGEVVDDRGRSIDLNGPSAGVAIDIAIHRNLWLTVLFSRAWSEVDLATTAGVEQRTFTVDTWHAGVLQEVPREKLRPFVGASIGVTRYDAGTLDADAEYLFGIALGGGVKLLLAEWIGIRAEARGMANFVSGAGALACGGGCVLVFDSDVLWLGEATIGAVLRF